MQKGAKRHLGLCPLAHAWRRHFIHSVLRPLKRFPVSSAAFDAFSSQWQEFSSIGRHSGVALGTEFPSGAKPQ